VHEDGFQVERLPDGELEFRDLYGRVIPEAPAPPEVAGDLNTGVQVDAHTLTPNWDGTRLNLDHVIWAMHPRASGH
jgi:hypothetical protein